MDTWINKIIQGDCVEVLKTMPTMLNALKGQNSSTMGNAH
jgi:DNA modification methylase